MSELDILLRLVVATALGGIIGYERESFHKPAGLRTHIFVTLGAALFTVISIAGFVEFTDSYSIDPTRIIAAILTGIGFIGAGVIIHRADHHVEGITTAAGLWVASGIGIAVGMGMYLIATVTVLISLVVFLGIEKLKPERKG